MPIADTNAAAVEALAQDQQYFLDLIDRLFPPEYLNPLKSPGPGYELYQAAAAVAARLSLAVARFTVGNFMRSAAGGQKATTTVLFSRPTFAAGAVTVKAGTVVTTSNGDRRFTLLADVAFGPQDLGPLPGDVQAVAASYQYNVPGQRTAANGEILPGDIDTIVSLVEDPAFGDPTITVAQVQDAAGGQAAMLDQLVMDRGLGRAASESDDSYRARGTSLPDTVSYGAVLRFLHALLDPLGATFDFIEVFDPQYQTCYDGPNVRFPAPSKYDPLLFVYDDPSPPHSPSTPHTFYGRWLGSELVGFIVVVPQLAVSQYAMAYDDTAEPGQLQIGPLHTGRRALSVYDMPANITTVLQGAYDGYDIGAAAVYQAMYNGLLQMRAAGVPFAIELQGQ